MFRSNIVNYFAADGELERTLRQHDLMHQIDLITHELPVMPLWDSNPFKSNEKLEEFGTGSKANVFRRFTTDTDYDPIFDYIL